MGSYGLCGKIVATEGQGDALAAHLLDAAAALENVPSCRLYLVSRDPGDPDAVWVVEVWDSADAHRASLQLKAVQKLIARARPLIAAMGERFELEPIGGKGPTLRAAGQPGALMEYGEAIIVDRLSSVETDQSQLVIYNRKWPQGTIASARCCSHHCGSQGGQLSISNQVIGPLTAGRRPRVAAACAKSLHPVVGATS